MDQEIGRQLNVSWYLLESLGWLQLCFVVVDEWEVFLDVCCEDIAYELFSNLCKNILFDTIQEIILRFGEYKVGGGGMVILKWLNISKYYWSVVVS